MRENGPNQRRRFWVTGKHIAKKADVEQADRKRAFGDAAGTTGMIRWNGSDFRKRMGDRAEEFANATGWIDFEADVLQTRSTPDEDAIKRFSAGEVVHLGTAGDSSYPRLRAGDGLWMSGDYGLPFAPMRLSDAEKDLVRRKPTLHWELFSEDNLLRFHERLGLWSSVEDADDNYEIDAEQLLTRMQEVAGMEAQSPADAKDFDPARVAELYRDEDFAASMRRTACKFVLEWGMPDSKRSAGVARSLQRAASWVSRNAALTRQSRQLEPQLWWAEAKAAGVPLPPSPNVFHYNPFAFAEAFSESDLLREDDEAASD